MSATYEPGTVAIATVHGKPNIRIMATSGVEWVTHQGFAVSDRDGDTTGNVTDVRPLVTLDLGEPVEGDLLGRNEARLFVDMLRETADNFFTPDAAALARKIADQIEAQTRPPKPAEPTGKYAEVEDAEGVVWFRDRNGIWRRPDFAGTEWQNVSAVRVLSEGVPA